MRLHLILHPLAATACMCLCTTTAFGAAVFSDDFEDDTVNSLPIVSGANIGDTYGVVNNVVQVAENPDATPAGGNTTAQVLSGAGSSTFGNNIPALFSSAVPIDGLTLSYDFYSAAGDHENDGIRVALIGNADNNRDVFIRNDRDTDLLIDGNAQQEVNFGDSVWQNFQATFEATDAAEGEYNVEWTITNLQTSATASGSQPVAINTANFTNGLARGLLLEAFEGNAGANEFIGYLDNVRVSAVPEPTTLAAAGFFGLGTLIARRRRRRSCF